MYSKVLLASAALAPLAHAVVAPPTLGYFVAEVAQPQDPGSPYLEEVNIAANNGLFYADKPTTASCGAGQTDCCYPNSYTSFSSSNTGVGSLLLNVGDTVDGAPQPQRVYCDAANYGALAYTPPNGTVPSSSSSVGGDNFTYVPEKTRIEYGTVSNAGNFSICETKDGYVQIFCSEWVDGSGLTCNSTGVALATRPDWGGVAAYQYDL